MQLFRDTLTVHLVRPIFRRGQLKSPNYWLMRHMTESESRHSIYPGISKYHIRSELDWIESLSSEEREMVEPYTFASISSIYRLFNMEGEELKLPIEVLVDTINRCEGMRSNFTGKNGKLDYGRSVEEA